MIKLEFCAVEIPLGVTRLSDSVNAITVDEFCVICVSRVGVGLPKTSEMTVEDRSWVEEREIDSVDRTNMMVVDEFCDVNISVVIVGSTKSEEETAKEDKFWSVDVSGVVLGIPEDGGVVEMSSEKDAAILVDETSTVETSLGFDDIENLADDVSSALDGMKVRFEICINLCQ